LKSLSNTRTRWQKFALGGLMASLLLAAWSAQAFVFNPFSGVLRRDWNLYESKHFRVYSDFPEAVVGRRIHDLELFRSFVHFAMGISQDTETPIVDVYLFSRRGHMFRLFNSDRMLGFMRPGLENSLMVIAPVYRTSNLNTVAFHEYVHFILRNVSGSHYPPWYEEGLAEFFAGTTIEKDSVVVGDIPPVRERNLFAQPSMTIASVMNAGVASNALPLAPQAPRDLVSLRDRLASAGVARNVDFYSHAWSIMHLLLLGHHAGLPRRDHLLVDYVLDIQQGGSPQRAYLEHFDNKYNELQKDLKSYLNLRSRLPKLTLPLSQFDYDPRYKRHAVQRSDMVYRFGRLVAPTSTLSARWLFEYALTLEPDSPRALAGLGMVRRMSGEYAKAVDLAERSLRQSADKDSGALAHFEFADTVSVVCRRANAGRAELAHLDCDELQVRALESYRVALTHSPNNAEFQANYGVALLRAGRTQQAEALLTAAYAKAPWSPGLSFALGECKRRQGEFERSKELLSRASVWFFKSPGLRANALAALDLAQREIATVPTIATDEKQLPALQ